jgi:diguanylate cyclase (GGDEF)-like protein
MMGYSFEVSLIVASLILLYLNPVAITTEFLLIMAITIPLMAVTIAFPVTLPSMLVSLELVFTLYLALVYDLSTALWVNFFAELAGALFTVGKTRKLVLLLNPAMKVVCLALGFLVFHAVAPLFEGLTSGLFLIKLFILTIIFFLANHLILNVEVFLWTQYFNLRSCLHAVRWETFVYAGVLPMAILGYVMEPYAGVYTLLILAVPVAMMTYLIRVFNRLQWSNRVNQLCIRLSTTKDLNTIYEQTFQIAQELTDSTRALLLKRQPEGTFEGIDTNGNVYERIEHPLLDRETLMRKVLTISSSTPRDNLIPEWDVRSFILIPLTGQKEVFGFLYLTKPSTHAFRQEQEKQLRFLANQVSIILDRNHVYEELEKAAITNQLTGLYNYQYFYEQLNEQFKHAKSRKRELALIIFDIDHFKKYNDIYGHVVGDEVLRQVSMIIKQVAAPHDVLLARYGGEEFVAIGSLTVMEAYALAEEVRRRIENHQFSYQEHTVKNITISGGVAHIHAHDCISPNDLLEKADQALYWGGKEMGRNRMAVFGAEYDQRLFVDNLTGLHTLTHLRRKMRSMCEREANFPLHFFLVDIRGMHHINEQFGFEVGNQVLIDASYLLKNTMRTDDQICRYLDDEFLVVIKGAHDTENVVRRIQEAFARHLFPMVGTTVTCDVIVVTMENQADEPHILEWVDQARQHFVKAQL